jgi:hypothetical protein
MRFFSGRESWAFCARVPEDLCGHHAELIEQALRPGERVRYLLYSPLREADGAPFGIEGGSGSHALALTDDRVIISRDPHRLESARTVRSVSFEDILVIEIGEALTLGWLVFRFAAGGRVVSEAIFFQSLGINLFRTAVRLCRRPTASGASLRVAEAEGWHAVLALSPPYLRTALLPLVLADERPDGVVYSAEQWRDAPGRHGLAFVAPAGLYAFTQTRLVIVESERPPKPGTLVFAVNATCVDRRIVRRLTVAADSQDPAAAELVVDLGTPPLNHRLTFNVSAGAADGLTQAIGGTPESR